MIPWHATLTALDARLLSTPSANVPIGESLRAQLAAAGQHYDSWFPPGSASVLVEGPEHSAWSSAIANQVARLDGAARLGESEAVTASGSVVVAGQILAPTVPIVVQSSAPNGAETQASGRLGGCTFTALDPGGLGNAITVAGGVVLSGGSPASAVTQSYTTDGVPHVTVTEVPATPPVSTPRLVISLGAYSEPFPGGASKLVAVSIGSTLPTSGTVTLSGGAGEVSSATRRLTRALTLPGVSDDTLAALRIEAALSLPSEPAYFVAKYYALAPRLSRSYSTTRDEFTAKQAARQALIRAGIDPNAPSGAPKGPTYGQIESGLTSAIASANAWLAVA